MSNIFQFFKKAYNLSVLFKCVNLLETNVKVQLTLKQHGFELSQSTFFFSLLNLYFTYLFFGCTVRLVGF